MSGHPMVLDDLVVQTDPVLRARRDAVISGLKRRKPESQLGRVDPKRRKLPENFYDAAFSGSPVIVSTEIRS